MQTGDASLSLSMTIVKTKKPDAISIGLLCFMQAMNYDT